jgi:hypothetical protein
MCLKGKVASVAHVSLASDETSDISGADLRADHGMVAGT